MRDNALGLPLLRLARAALRLLPSRSSIQTFIRTRQVTRPARLVFVPKTSKTNAHLQRVVRELRDLSRENEVGIWRDVAERLERARRNWSEVNLSRVNRYAEKGQKVVVPGVLLASGELTFPVTVGAFRTSEAARKKVEAAGGQALSLLEFAVQNPKGSGVRLLG